LASWRVGGHRQRGKPCSSERIDPVEIGHRIAQARNENLGVTQRELAQLVGVSLQAVQQWERGARSPLRQLDRLAGAMGVSRDWLLWGEAEESAAIGLESRVAASEDAIASLTRAIETLIPALAQNGVDVSLVRQLLPSSPDLPVGTQIDVVSGES
jgi:transcriptional regulator with XRE-family HTH domain